MNDLHAIGPHKYIRDRVGNRFLASWSGPDTDPTAFTWTTKIEEAHDLLANQAHTLRAGILATPAERGGLPETHVAIVDVVSAKAFAKDMEKPPSEVTERVMLHHPLQGYYVKHFVDGDKWTITWSQERVMAAIIPRQQAEEIRDLSGIPALGILPLNGLASTQPTLDKVAAAAPGQSVPPRLPPPAPAQPMTVSTKLRYELFIESDTEAMVKRMNDALAKGAQLAGALCLRPSQQVGATATQVEYIQPVIWREPLVQNVPGKPAAPAAPVAATAKSAPIKILPKA